MENTVELGFIGDLLIAADNTYPTPLRGVVGSEGLKGEHFGDQTCRAAFEAAMDGESDDPAVWKRAILARVGVEFCEKAIAAASPVPALALDRIRRLAEAGRKRLVGEALVRLVRTQSACTEDFFFAEADRIVRTGMAAQAGRHLAIEPVAKFLAVPPPAADPIVGGCFEPGDKVELIAPSKCRKSFFALDLALHIAAGLPFAMMSVPKRRRVLLVNLEIKRDWMKRRLLRRLAGYGITMDELGDRLLMMNCRGQGATVREAILAQVRALSPDFVILDPRYKLQTPEEDENTGGGLIGILNLLDGIAESGAAVMVVAHDRKGEVRTLDIRDRGAGSGWAGRDVDCRFVLTPDKDRDDRMTLGILARNYPPRRHLPLTAAADRFCW